MPEIFNQNLVRYLLDSNKRYVEYDLFESDWGLHLELVLTNKNGFKIGLRIPIYKDVDSLSILISFLKSREILFRKLTL